jgi:hypothetical protein
VQAAGIGQRHFGVDGTVGIVAVFQDAGNLGHEQQLVGLQSNRGGGRHFFHAQIESLAGGRKAERTEQHQRADIDSASDCRGIDPAHHTGMHEIHTVDDAHRPGGQKVS